MVDALVVPIARLSTATRRNVDGGLESMPSTFLRCQPGHIHCRSSAMMSVIGQNST